MNMNPPECANTKQSPIELMITSDLGYCCLWAFFKRNKRTAMIAIRLGVSDRSVRLYKARFKEGEFSCEAKEKCLKCYLVK